ncbi:MAG TPA: hypothetical protein VM582_04180 [Candidatus Thermoplasmatota archaeon]|nr:hypothetical protein [Candidatus Thermoplasmatota archaeon]
METRERSARREGPATPPGVTNRRPPGWWAWLLAALPSRMPARRSLAALLAVSGVLFGAAALASPPLRLLLASFAFFLLVLVFAAWLLDAAAAWFIATSLRIVRWRLRERWSELRAHARTVETLRPWVLLHAPWLDHPELLEALSDG